MATIAARKFLSQSGLLQAMRKAFETIADDKKNAAIPLVDHLMSGLALFGLKFPSLLQFDRGRDDDIIRHNLQTLYGIERVPCDTYLRQRLDEINPAHHLRKPFTQAFHLLQRGKGLESGQSH